MPKNYEPGNSSDSSRPLQGYCWRCKIWHRTTVPPATRPQSPLNMAGNFFQQCRTRSGYHSLALFVFSICLVCMLSHWQGRSLAGEILFSLSWTMLLCLASWNLLSSTGAWLLTEGDEAKCNELDRPGRQNTAHASPSSFLGKGSRGLQIIPLTYSHFLWTLALSFLCCVHRHKVTLWTFWCPQKLVYRFECISMCSAEPTRSLLGLTHIDIFMETFPCSLYIERLFALWFRTLNEEYYAYFTAFCSRLPVLNTYRVILNDFQLQKVLSCFMWMSRKIQISTTMQPLPETLGFWLLLTPAFLWLACPVVEAHVFLFTLLLLNT